MVEKGEAAAAPRSPLVRKKFWSSDMEAVFGITLVLLVLGTVNVFSSSFVSAELRFDDAYFFLKRHLISMSLGLVLFFIGARADYHIWRKLMPWVLALTVLALVAVFFIGPEVNGARRWLPLPFMQVQPAEGAKLVAIMLASASMAARVRHKARVSPFNLQYACILVMAALVEKEPDMGTACVIIGVPIILYLVAAQLPLRRLLAVLAALAAGAAFFIMSQTYRIERVRIMWDPWQDAQNAGYQIVQSLSTIGSGEFLGMGLGVGVSKYDYLPEAHTDFAFAIFCQENGYLGALFVFLLYTALAPRVRYRRARCRPGDLQHAHGRRRISRRRRAAAFHQLWRQLAHLHLALCGHPREHRQDRRGGAARPCTGSGGGGGARERAAPAYRSARRAGTEDTFRR